MDELQKIVISKVFELEGKVSALEALITQREKENMEQFNLIRDIKEDIGRLKSGIKSGDITIKIDNKAENK